MRRMVILLVTILLVGGKETWDRRTSGVFLVFPQTVMEEDDTVAHMAQEIFVNKVKFCIYDIM